MDRVLPTPHLSSSLLTRREQYVIDLGSGNRIRPTTRRGPADCPPSAAFLSMPDRAVPPSNGAQYGYCPPSTVEDLFGNGEFSVNTYVRGVVFIQSSVVIVASRFTLEPSLKQQTLFTFPSYRAKDRQQITQRHGLMFQLGPLRL